MRKYMIVADIDEQSQATITITSEGVIYFSEALAIIEGVKNDVLKSANLESVEKEDKQ